MSRIVTIKNLERYHNKIKALFLTSSSLKTINRNSIVGTGNISINSLTDEQAAALSTLGDKVNKTDLATINGKPLYEGGNILVSGGGDLPDNMEITDNKVSTITSGSNATKHYPNVKAVIDFVNNSISGKVNANLLKTINGSSIIGTEPGQNIEISGGGGIANPETTDNKITDITTATEQNKNIKYPTAGAVKSYVNVQTSGFLKESSLVTINGHTLTGGTDIVIGTSGAVVEKILSRDDTIYIAIQSNTTYIGYGLNLQDLNIEFNDPDITYALGDKFKMIIVSNVAWVLNIQGEYKLAKDSREAFNPGDVIEIEGTYINDVGDGVWFIKTIEG